MCPNPVRPNAAEIRIPSLMADVAGCPTDYWVLPFGNRSFLLPSACFNILGPLEAPVLV